MCRALSQENLEYRKIVLVEQFNLELLACAKKSNLSSKFRLKDEKIHVCQKQSDFRKFSTPIWRSFGLRNFQKKRLDVICCKTHPSEFIDKQIFAAYLNEKL